MNPLSSHHRPRRQFLWEMGAGFAGLALTSLLEADGFFGKAQGAELPSDDPLRPKIPTIPTKAKSCIFLFMFGGPSQVDLFDYKPELQKRDGQTVENEFRRQAKSKATLQASRRTFKQHGQSGLWCSDAFPHLSQHMDKLAVVKSLYSDSFSHGSALLQMNSGRILQGHPSLGAWMNYGLGTMNQNLPGDGISISRSNCSFICAYSRCCSKYHEHEFRNFHRCKSWFVHCHHNGYTIADRFDRSPPSVRRLTLSRRNLVRRVRPRNGGQLPIYHLRIERFFP